MAMGSFAPLSLVVVLCIFGHAILAATIDFGGSIEDGGRFLEGKLDGRQCNPQMEALGPTVLEQGAQCIEAEFMGAIERGDLERIRDLMQGDGAEEIRGVFGANESANPVHAAILQGEWDIALHLVQERVVPLNKGDMYSGRTVLFCAAEEGHAGLVQALLEGGAAAEATDHAGSTALHAAAAAGHVAVVAVLLAREPGMVDVLDGAGRSALHVAAQNGHVAVVELLLELDAYVDSVANCKDTPLICATVESHVDVVQALLRRFPTVNHANAKKRGALYMAVRLGRIGIARLLLEAGADVHARDVHGRTPLHCAVLRGCAGAVRLLLEWHAGADADVADCAGQSPRSLALARPNEEIRASIMAIPPATEP